MLSYLEYKAGETDGEAAARQGPSSSLYQSRCSVGKTSPNPELNLPFSGSLFPEPLFSPLYATTSIHKRVLGDNHFVLFPNAENQALFEQVRDTGRPVRFQARPFEFPGQPERGTTYWDWTLVPVQGSEGQVQGLVLSLLDVTDLEQARALSEALNRIRTQTISSTDIQVMLPQILGEVVRALGAEVGGFIGQEDDRWVLRHLQGLPEELGGQQIADDESDVASWLAEHRDVLVIDDLADRPHFKLPLARPYGLRSLVVIPLWLKEHLTGALMVGHRSRAAHFGSQQIDFCRRLSSLLALALENARLYEQARQEAETRAVLLREVNHWVKNNLPAIVGLLYAQQDRTEVKGQPAYRTILQELIHWTTGLSVAHQMLSTSAWAPLRLDALADRVLQSCFQATPPGQVGVRIESSAVRVSPDQAHTLALVLNELGLNVLKHAVPRRESCMVHVEVDQQDGDVVLVMHDDGPGYPEEILAKTRSSVGIEIVRNLVTRNLRGRVTLRNEGGAVTEVRFPLGKEAAEGVVRD